MFQNELKKVLAEWKQGFGTPLRMFKVWRREALTGSIMSTYEAESARKGWMNGWQVCREALARDFKTREEELKKKEEAFKTEKEDILDDLDTLKRQVRNLEMDLEHRAADLKEARTWRDQAQEKCNAIISEKKVINGELASLRTMLQNTEAQRDALLDQFAVRLPYAWVEKRASGIKPEVPALETRDHETLVAAATAHRACCSTEHDPANGKLHGCCVVCGVPWPCETAKKFLG